MVSANEGWVVGAMWKSNTNFFHYLNGKWFPVARPAGAPKGTGGIENVANIAMASATEGWGISEDGIYHYHKGTWSTWYTRGPDEML